MHIMKFSGYDNLESILKLKCKKEINKMFKFVVKRVTLVQDKDDMFGIFAEDISILEMLPGLKPTFKRFLGKVKNLIPNPATRRKRLSQGTSNSPLDTKSKKNHLDTETLTPDKKIATAEELGERYKKWLSKKVQETNQEMSIEDQEKLFTLK